MKLAGSLVCLLLAAPFAGGTAAFASEWREVAPMPEPRWFHTAGVGSDGKIYVYGGYVRTARSLREYGLGEWSLVIYDPATHGWTRGPRVMPYRLRRRRRVSAGTIYRKDVSWKEDEIEGRVENEVFSGEADPLGLIHWFENTGLGAVVFDPSKSEWTQMPSPMVLADKPDWTLEDLRKGISKTRYEGTFPANARTVATTATSADGKIYVIGGTALQSKEAVEIELLAGVDVYDAAANTWKSIASMREARQLHAAAFGPDGKLYVFGGYAGTGGYQSHPNDPGDQAKAEVARRAAQTSLASVERYDPSTNTWMERAPMPRPRQQAGAALAADGRIYVVGGTYSYMSPLPVDDVDIYDPRTDRWSRGPSLRHPRRSHAVVATADGRIYAIGGHVIRSGLSAWLPGSPVEENGQDLRATVEVLETKPNP